MYTSPIILELNYWINTFYDQFASFIVKYLNVSYQHEQLAKMFENNRNYTFDYKNVNPRYISNFQLNLFNYVSFDDIGEGTFELFEFNSKRRLLLV